MRKCGENPEVARLLSLHRWAGHVARMPAQSQPSQALRARGMQWWRWAQTNHFDKKWTGVHPKRFKVWRWESQVAEIYGDGYAEDTLSNTGWLAAAQSRSSWKEGEKAYSDRSRS